MLAALLHTLALLLLCPFSSSLALSVVVVASVAVVVPFSPPLPLSVIVVPPIVVVIVGGGGGDGEGGEKEEGRELGTVVSSKSFFVSFRYIRLVAACFLVLLPCSRCLSKLRQACRACDRCVSKLQ